ncbi:hypothetical protein BU25DRAFT_455978 [Macroventuria anomochaeta]|uniref:Uncharacterized protein n=1 Tax=Macroventuria anomochaeta TaxID=301207 RepID=A0ACB6S9L3_9PLEO|nr:uncharacterized protein BU25DRAFT_455978 [Macroventuria anomochaeta]KAF2630207.1 hypothetical protein BU25DRAFT_455978 [Macroventuria anomochaeta]
MPQWIFPQQQGTANATTNVAPTAGTFNANDFSEGIWRKLSTIGPSFCTDLRTPNGRVKHSALEAEPNLHQNVLKNTSSAASAAGLTRLLNIAHQRGEVPLQQLEPLRDCAMQAQSNNAVTPVNNTLVNTTQVTFPTALFRTLLVPIPKPSSGKPPPIVINRTDPIRDELSNLGSNLHTDLKRSLAKGMIRAAEPNFEQRVLDVIYTVASSDGLIEFLKFHRGLSRELGHPWIEELCNGRKCR